MAAAVGVRAESFFALGIMYWLYDRTLEPTLRWIDAKFTKNPNIAEANRRALKATAEARCCSAYCNVV